MTSSPPGPSDVFVEYENAVLSQAGIAPSQIVAALQQQNIIRPGGAVDVGNTAFQLRPSGDFQSLADMENALIRAGDGTMVRLGDIIEVSHGYQDPPRQIAYFNGRESVILAVAMEDGLSVLTYVERARARVDEVRETLPVGLNLDIMTNEAPKVESAVYGVTRNMIQTLVIVLGIVILFLGVRTGLIVGSIVPAVILATFAIMGLFGIPLQRMSLATIIISLGLLVDNGIVIAEDFKRRVVELGDRDEALKQTSSELAWPLLSSSLTTIVVFLPLLINATSSTEYTRTITLVIMITLSVSWLFAMTVTTTLCHRFLKVPDEPKPEDEKPPEKQAGITVINRAFDHLTDLYERFLRFILGIRWWYLAAMFGLFFTGNLVSQQVPTEFFPSNDNPQVLIYVELPSGVTTRATDEKMREMIALAQDEDRFEGVGDIAAYTGFGGPRFVLSLAPVDPAPNKGFMIVNADDLEATDALVPALREAFLTEFPGVNTRVTRMFLGPEDPAVIQVQVTGPDADYLNDKAEEVMEMMAATDGMIDIWSDWRGRTPILEVDVRQDTARAAGVSSADIAASLARHIDGEPVTMFRDGDEIYPVTMRAAQSERTSLDALSGIAVYPSGGGESVPLGTVADIRMDGGWGFIQREELERTVQIEGRNLKTTPEDLVPVLQPKIDELNANIAPGHEVKIAGILEETAENNAALAATAPLLLGLIMFLLITQFGGFKRPLVILFTLPFITFGAFLGLWLFGATFGFMAILSLFALAGIIINNSIVLVDRMDIERTKLSEDMEEGDRPTSAGKTEADEKAELDALIAACRRRFRPVIMTTLTTIAGLLPLIISGDVLFYGFAISVAVGLFVGTPLLSLGLTPVLYALFLGIARGERREKKIWDKLALRQRLPFRKPKSA